MTDCRCINTWGGSRVREWGASSLDKVGKDLRSPGRTWGSKLVSMGKENGQAGERRTVRILES